MESLKKNIPIILFSILPVSIILGSSALLVNVVLFSLFFIVIYLNQRSFKIYDFKPILFLIILNLYLVFNSLISIDLMSGIFRNFGFTRFILFFLMVNYLFFINEKNLNILKIWTIIFFVVLVDVYIERFTGSNILGFSGMEDDYQSRGYRVVSFFKTEPIPGAFICGFAFIILGYILSFLKSKKKFKIIGFLIILFCLAGIMLTGERSNSLKALMGFLIFISIIDYVKLKFKILVLLSFFLTFIFLINFSDYVKYRYVDQLINKIKTKDEREKFFENNLYIKLYKSGIYVFKNNPLLGVGNKNYRIETCDSKRDPVPKEYYCLTHPHQIYIEMLSEHGIFGTIIIMSIIFYLAFRILRKIIDSKNYIQAGCLIFLLINFAPILPSGSFFNNFNITLFMINFSLMYAINKETNIFRKR